ncbi:MAG: DUF4350 domain-containing protein [Cyclobacteriaceae bacterium]|nr:DUF4350 domain-containing protein [Cyclobacteriaceae bacterium]
MKKDWKYLTYLGILAVMLVILMLSKSKQYDWSVTFSHEDKNPYGTYALNQLLPSVVKNSVRNSYQTLYELKDSLHTQENIFILSGNFSPGKEDTEMLLNYASHGGTLFISANHFYGSFADTLGIVTRDSFFQGNNVFNQNDSAALHFVSRAMDSTRQYWYKASNIHNYFSDIDSVQATVISKNDFHQPISVRIKRGLGTILLNCTPMVFTNIHLLDDDNHEFASTSLSYMPQKDTYWTEFYHLGRMEVATPLRFILTSEPLRWAYYLAFISILLFIVFESKRKQRIIPVINPPTNTTLEFVGTIGNLYYQRGDHKNIAEKKIQFFLDQIHTTYFISSKNKDEEYLVLLSKKTGVPEQTVSALFKEINRISEQAKISVSELTRLNDLIEKFHQKK